MVEQFDVSQNKARIGLITFSRYPFLRFGLNDTANMSQVLEAVGNVPYVPGIRETHTALHLLQQEGFKGSRSNVVHVAILLTAGASVSLNETQAIAIKIHNQGIQMLVVGIGDRVSKTELISIATNPDDKHLILVHNYTMITEIQEKLTTLTCDVAPHSYTPSSTANPVLIQNARQEPIKECVGKVADIVFLLDSSTSLGTQHFKSVEHFAMDIVNDLDIQENATMVGVISFSTYPVRRVTLGTTDDKLHILNAINQIPYYAGSRETDKALEMLRIEGFEGERQDVPRVVILITDGYSTNAFLTGRAADELKQTVTEIFVVGIGPNVSKQELDRISTGGSNHVFNVHNFLELDLSGFEGVVAGAVCKAIPEVTTTTTTTWTTPTVTTADLTTASNVPPTKMTASECMPDVKDVVFLVDSSGSIGDENFEHVKNFIKQTIGTFEIGSNKTRVGLILFNSDAVILFTLDQYDLKQTVLDAVDKITYRPGGTNTADALELLRTQGFINNRTEAAKIAFLITDGYSSDKNATERQAELAKENDTMLIFATAIGQLLDFQELEVIASTNPITNRTLIYHVDDFDELHVNSLEMILANVICGVDIPPTTVSPTVSTTKRPQIIISTSERPVLTTTAQPQNTESNTARYHASMSTSTHSTTDACIDKVPNCDEYELEMCTSYRPWAMAHCKHFCGFCQGQSVPPVPCVDTIGNCREYGHDICTSLSFRKWTKDHCARFCEFCGVDIHVNPDSLHSTSASTVPPQTTKVNTLNTEQQTGTFNMTTCSDKINNCAEFGQDICTDYAPWAKKNCNQYCGFCKGPTTTTAPCMDTIGNCREYPADVCISLTFLKWAKEHCAKFCNFCETSSSTPLN